MSPKNALYTKQYNRLLILRLLRRSACSRAELARLTGLTRAAISLITEELIKENLIRESSAQAPTARGRTPILLELCPKGCFCAGVYLTRRDCTLGICDLSGALLISRSLDTIPGQLAPKEALALLAQQLQALIQESNIENLLGVGIAAPGPVDTASGMILNPPQFPLWQNVEICSYLEQALSLPVYLENDANALAMYNHLDHPFKEKDNFLLLYVGNGVGSSVISNGQLLRSKGFSCELGHSSIDFMGKPCSCGSRGCLERYASRSGLLEDFPGYSSWDALMASPARDAVLEREAMCLGTGIVNFINTLRMDAVVLAGSFYPYYDELLPKLRRFIQGRCLVLGQQPIPILPALHGPHSEILSACSIVTCRYLNI